jgi:hypothetical protein
MAHENYRILRPGNARVGPWQAELHRGLP